MVGVICTTLSPATAIAVVREMKCKGLLTTTMLGITVIYPSSLNKLYCATTLCAIFFELSAQEAATWHSLSPPLFSSYAQVLSDVVVLICITLSFAVGKSSCSGKPIDGAAIGIVISMIFVSIILGVLLGEGRSPSTLALVDQYAGGGENIISFVRMQGAVLAVGNV